MNILFVKTKKYKIGAIIINKNLCFFLFFKSFIWFIQKNNIKIVKIRKILFKTENYKFIKKIVSFIIFIFSIKKK